MATVLIADDDHLVRWSLEKFLGQGGHTVHAVESGAAAIAAAESGRYEVVVTDYAMPEVGGFEVLFRVKAHSPATQIIFITGRGTRHTERLARDGGAFDFLEKPFPLAALLQAVERAASNPERRSGPRGCCGGCSWRAPCESWRSEKVGVA